MKQVSFCGISGSGMSALAQVLKVKGFDVSGSDRSFDCGKDIKSKIALEEVGIKIFPQDGSSISKSTQCLYVSTAVEDTIPDIKKAKELGVDIKKRSDLLAEIFNLTEYGIAVGGTSGKTTVTAMIGFILDKLNYKPVMINGGLLKNYANQKGIPNVILNDNSKVCVIEADESDGSIEKYYPYIAVVNNISIDHKPIVELQQLFTRFVEKASKGAVVNLDCKNSEVLLNKNNIVTFSIRSPKANVYLYDIKPLQNSIEYKLNKKTYRLNLTGSFNVANAACAIAVCTIMGITGDVAAKTLEGFLGTRRRLDVIGIKKQITVIDDFAHNPDKVAASMSALKDYEGRLLIMFQPHGFSPMRMMGRGIMESFAQFMKKDDILFMPEIFYAGGSVTRDISSKDLVDYAKKIGINAEFYQTREEIKNRFLSLAESGDRIVVMGARDNSLPDFCEDILERL